MAGFDFRMATGGFFDRAAVVRAMDAATRRNLSKFGAFVRTRSRSSIRSRKRVSNPGEPPSSHTSTLKALIFFSYDPGKKTVVIGPTVARKGEAPALLEYGGEATRRVGKLVKAEHYRPRPFMGPAFEIEKRNLSPLWRDSVR